MQVLVIESGQVVEHGTHNELVGRDGVYKRLVIRQLMAADREGGGEMINDSFPGLLTKNNW